MPLMFEFCSIIQCEIQFAKNLSINEVESSAKKITRTLGVSEFKINHRIMLRSFIRGHQVYTNIWSLYTGEKLAAHLHDQEEALECDKYSVGIYEKKDDDCDE